jgi:hypothetical protein
MTKVDLKKDLKHLYQPRQDNPVQVDIPTMNYLMIDGAGDPNTAQAYKDAIEALFPLSYTLKFMVKKGPQAIDYGVMPLEGLWWADDMSTFNVKDKSNWKWTLMMMQPKYVDKAIVKTAMAEVEKKKNPSGLSNIRFEAFSEGKAAQIMHIGPFSEEGPTVEKLHRFIEQSGHTLSGKHHEIYLSDIRKADPKKWKTIIRQPMS